MINIQQIQNLPQNIDRFIMEIGGLVRTTYGEAAELAYVEVAEGSYGQLINHPDVWMWGSVELDSPGLLMCVIRRGVAHITLLHVLEGESGNGYEAGLLEMATNDLREHGVRAILAEFVRQRPLSVERPMAGLGFTKFDRQMMIADLNDAAWTLEEALFTAPSGLSDTAAARILVDAYKNHPSRPLHPETHDQDSANAFLKAFRGGTFGHTTPDFYRNHPWDGSCQGMITGAEAAPGVGFILHVATARASQGRGIGARLIRETAAEFRRAGYDRMVLGVTCGNPAERLYDRLGFRAFLPVESYAWWAKPNAIA